MAVHHLLHRGQELRQPPPRRKPQHHRRQVRIGAGARGHQVVEEHAFLQRRQRVDVGHVRRPAVHPVHDPADLLLGQLGQRHHFRGDLLRPGRDQVRRHRHHLRLPAARASPAGAGASNSARTETATPRSRSRCTSDTASSECPPSAKKPSSAPTCPGSRPSTSANTPQMISSRTVAGPGPAPRRGVVGGGQRGPVGLPAHRQRQRIQHHHRSRHHVVGQPLRGERAHRPGQPRAVSTGPSSTAVLGLAISHALHTRRNQPQRPARLYRCGHCMAGHHIFGIQWKAHRSETETSSREGLTSRHNALHPIYR